MSFLSDINPSSNPVAKNILNGTALAGSVYSALFPSAVSRDPASNDIKSLSKYLANLNGEGRRLTKGYYYGVSFYGFDKSISPKLMFNCADVTLPGWKSRTQKGKIYGLEYEIPVQLEQDPLWLTFDSDIMHEIESYFMYNRKLSLFHITNADNEFLSVNSLSYSPKYKEDNAFSMHIEVTDEFFRQIKVYNITNAFVKTVQNVNYGSNIDRISQVKVEVCYEEMHMVTLTSERARANPNPDAKDRNKLKFGPFEVDVSQINQVVGNYSKIPSWFSSPQKI